MLSIAHRRASTSSGHHVAMLRRLSGMLTLRATARRSVRRLQHISSAQHANQKYAILIDADNVPPRLAGAILDEVSRSIKGSAVDRRVYGDFSQPRNAPHDKGDQLCRFRLRHAKNELGGQNLRRMAVTSPPPPGGGHCCGFGLGLGGQSLPFGRI